MAVCDFEWRQRAIVNAQLVDVAVFEAAVAKPLAEREMAGAEDGHHCLFLHVVAKHFRRELLAIEKYAQTGGRARTVVGDGDVLPRVSSDRRSRPHADGVAGPDAIQAGGENSVLQHQVKSVVADIGAERALQDHDGLCGAGRVAHPEVEAEFVPAIDFENAGNVGASIAVKANRMSADALDA